MNWIRLEDELPPVKTSVMITDGKDIGITKVQYDKAYGILIQFGTTKVRGKITHWAKLPDLPNGNG